MNTEFCYMYRDASNYKQAHIEVFAGVLRAPARRALKAALCAGDGFIPSQIGLRDLQTRFGGVNGDDHVWHELLELTATEHAPTQSRTIQEFAAETKQVDGNWDIQAGMQRVGLVPGVPMIADGGPNMSEYEDYISWGAA